MWLFRRRYSCQAQLIHTSTVSFSKQGSQIDHSADDLLTLRRGLQASHAALPLRIWWRAYSHDRGRLTHEGHWLRPSEKRLQGNAVCIYLSGGSPKETTTIFDQLSEGAQVTDPLAQQPYGMYGALNDKFGIRWMFHSEQ